MYYFEVHWFSKSKVLQCSLSLLGENKVFLIEKVQPITTPFEDARSWIYDLSFLTDICGQLNNQYNKLQEKCPLVSKLYNNLSAFQTKWVTLVTLQTVKKIIKQCKINKGMSDTLGNTSSQLQADLWTSIRTEHCLAHLLTLLKHHIRCLTHFTAQSNWTTLQQWTDI